MNIDDLTIKQARELAALFGASQPTQPAKQHPFVGKYVIARCYAAGVHAGTVESVDGDSVVLRDSVRLWSWKAKEGVALSGLAQSGMRRGEGKIDTQNPVICLIGVCELIPCSDAAKGTFNA
jgi:hypothetical protein